MSVLRLPYRSPAWLRWPVLRGHVQTIVPAVLAHKPQVTLRRERWEATPGGVPDGDFVDVDFVDADDPTAPIVVLFHGLEGSAQSHYARSLMYWTHERGWAGAVPHFRGCSGEANRTRRAYHSGDSAEIDWILRRIAAEHPQRPLYATGVSLGGNALAKWLGEQGEAASFVQRAAVISAPLDLNAGGAALKHGFSMVYTRMFLRTLKHKTAAKFALHPDIGTGPDYLETLKRVRDLEGFDDLYTAPVHGFANAQDYWTRSSAKPWLKHITVPTLVLNARNDPFQPASALPQAHEVSAAVRLEQPEDGGHVGFAVGPFPGQLHWLSLRILRWIDGH